MLGTFSPLPSRSVNPAESVTLQFLKLSIVGMTSPALTQANEDQRELQQETLSDLALIVVRGGIGNSFTPLQQFCGTRYSRQLWSRSETPVSGCGMQRQRYSARKH